MDQQQAESRGESKKEHKREKIQLSVGKCLQIFFLSFHDFFGDSAATRDINSFEGCNKSMKKQ
jgi:hypothetical protein